MGVKTLAGDYEVDITEDVHLLRRRIQSVISMSIGPKTAACAPPEVTFAIASNAVAFALAELVHAANDTREGRGRILRTVAKMMSDRLEELDERKARGKLDDGSVH